MTDHPNSHIQALVKQLSAADPLARLSAGDALVEIGAPAVPALMAALDARDGQVRWGAARALGKIAEPASVEALVRTLEDQRHDVRWLAAQALITIGADSIRPLLEALAHSPWDALILRQGAHHVLHELVGTEGNARLAPVIAALEGREAGMTVPVAAFKALSALQE